MLYVSGETLLRPMEDDIENRQICQTITGIDQNSMYGFALRHKMPVGFYFRRKSPDFQLTQGGKGKQASKASYEWLSYMEQKLKTKIIHEFGSGSEFRVGSKKLPVDGYVPSRKLCLEFHGCYYHYHDGKQCSASQSTRNSVANADPEKKRKKKEFDQKKKEYIQALGYEYQEMWECQWTQIKTDPNIAKEVSAACLLKYEGPAWQKDMTQQRVLELVDSEDLFALIKVDIHVPESLKDTCREFSPFFKHASISREDVGPHMKAYCEEAGVLKHPTGALIGSMFAKDFWISTPLLRWYRRLGCVVDKVHELVQWEGVACFEKFMDEITEARRAADEDPDMKIHGDCSKLTGIPFTYR